MMDSVPCPATPYLPVAGVVNSTMPLLLVGKGLDSAAATPLYSWAC